MSNLTRLQAVSSSLDTAINKAESLPEAGSGGGTSVETCTVTLEGAGPDIATEFCYYNGTSLQRVFIPDMMSDPVILNDVPKNSIAVLYGGLDRLDGSIEVIYSNPPLRVLFIAGDSSITSS